MNKPSQEVIDKLIEYFNTNGIDLNEENGSALQLDQKMVERSDEKWSIDILVLTGKGVSPGYYRHENKAFTVKGHGPFDIFTKHVEMLSNKFVHRTDEHRLALENILY